MLRVDYASVEEERGKVKNFLLCGLGCLFIGALYGCGLMDAAMGIQQNPDGTVSTGGGIADTASNVVYGILAQFGLYGAGAAGLLRWGTVEYKHHRLIKMGRPDANRNGVDDEIENPKPPAAA